MVILIQGKTNKKELIRIRELILKNRSPDDLCSYECKNNLIVKSCPYLIDKQKNKLAENPIVFVCGKNFLIQYEKRIKQLSSKKKDVLKLFAKPKMDCLLKEDKFKTEKKKEKIYDTLFDIPKDLSQIFITLYEENFACYSINTVKLNKFACIYKFKFIDFNSNLLVCFDFYKDGNKQRIIKLFVSKKEEEFYKISGGV